MTFPHGCRNFRQQWRLNRRAVLRAGVAGTLGLSLGQLLARRARANPAAAMGRAKRCIFFFMWGGPSQLDTFDMKPLAPDEVRGEFQPVATAVPGLQICEHFTHLAPLMDQVAVVRSLHHDDPAHLSSAHATLTGHWARVLKSDAEPPSNKDAPHLGAMLARVRPQAGALPPFVTLPWQTSHPAAPGGRAPGQTAGWLGKRYDPLVVEGDPSRDDWKIAALDLQPGLSLSRLEDRRGLLNTIDQQRQMLARVEAADLDQFQQQALDLLSGPAARTAFDLAGETPETRERYGLNLHGQCALLARRLAEAGVPLVSVNWHNDGHNFWDTHGQNFKRLKRELIPPADRALAALLTDLRDRGLLEETVVAWVGEFGRRPQINRASAGREHWPYCYSGLLAGGGIQGGAVWGASDRLAAHPEVDPVSPLDFAATLYWALGIDPQTTVLDRGGRPTHLADGRPIRELFG